MKGNNAMATFDLAELEQTDTAVMEIVHPSTGDEIGASVTLYGQDSDIFRAESRKAEARYTEYSRRNRGKFMPPEDREKLDKSKVIACVKSIDGLAFKGKALTDAGEVFAQFPWIYEQCVSFVMDRAGFLKGSAKK